VLSKTIAAAHAIIRPGALREMHWHPNADEWSFFIRGRARVTIFASEGTARTFDFGPGDVGIVPRNMGHFVVCIFFSSWWRDEGRRGVCAEAFSLPWVEAEASAVRSAKYRACERGR
jgi:oxalate decarboxylase/phosphoglucose isomerase-like protein (cupin superfamily)